MSNEIDLIVGSEAFAQITKLLTELGKVDTSFTELSAKFAALGNNTNTIKSTADLAKLTAENAKLNAVIEQQIKDFSDLNAKLAQATTARTSTTKAVTEASIAQRELNAQTTLNIKATTDAVGAYAKLDAQHKLAVKTAQDLAVATGRTGQAYEDAKNKANELGGRLRVIDTDIGKHTRNVGNYSSSWNGLGNSINQLTREAPAFANSVQTGFMALSNNIPILTDELGVLIQKNKDLQAEGKPTQSILKTVAGAFFSWQTAISLGVTILTVYGAKIWDMVSGLDALKRKQEAFAISQKLMDNQIEQTTKNIIQRTELLVNESKVRGESADKQRAIILQGEKDIQANLILRRDSDKKKYENAKYYSDLDNEREEINRKIALAGGLFKYKLSEEQAKLKVKLEKNTAELIRYENWKQSSQGLADLNNAAILSESAVKEQGKKITLLKSGQKVEEFNENKKNQKNIDKEGDKLAEKEAKTEEERLRNAFNRKISDLEKQKELDSDSLNLFTGTLQEKQILSATLAADETLIVEAKYQEELRLAEGNADLIAIAENNKFKAINNIRDENIKRVQDMYSEEEKIQAKSLKKAEDAEKERLAKLAKYQKEVESYLNSFGTEFASKIGLSETFNMLSGNIAGFGKDAAVTFVAVAEAAQEMFNIIAESSAANYDAEYSRLNKQKEEAIKNAGNSTAAKEKIEADYDKKKKEIQLREFKAKQKITIANIAIDTAQAIVSTYAQVPKYDFGVSASTLAFIIAGLGAAQIGMVASQKPPAYADGTDNHSGGLMLVNDGSGSNYQEKVILPSGKVIRPQGRNVLMDAPKGTKVLNHEQQLFEMLQSNNISMSSQGNSGLTYDEMNEIFKQNLSNIKTQNTIFDKNGFQSYVKNGNSITRSNSNRSQAIGISV